MVVTRSVSTLGEGFVALIMGTESRRPKDGRATPDTGITIVPAVSGG